MTGPAFLRRPKEEWPKETPDTPMENDPEMNNSKHKHIGAVVPAEDLLGQPHSLIGEDF